MSKIEHRPSLNEGSSLTAIAFDNTSLSQRKSQESLISTSKSVNDIFVRDRLIWLYYMLIGTVAFMLSSLGPLMPFMRAELKLNYSISALHFSAFAFGLVVSGLVGDRFMRVLGRQKTLWLAGTCAVIGIITMCSFYQPIFTVSGTWLAGLGSSMLYLAISTVVADRLGEQRTLAMLEAEVLAMLTAGLAPFAVSAFVRIGLGWRTALFVLIPVLATLLVLLRDVGIVEPVATVKIKTAHKLPLAFWAYGSVIFLSCACEWSLGFWSADFLERHCILTKPDASAAVGAFFIAMLVGRFSGSRLVTRFGIPAVLSLSALLSVFGFLLFWLGNPVIFNIVGLFICGLGIANMYPMSICGAVSAASSQASVALARLGTISGSAVLVAPLVLGLYASNAGIHAAFGIVELLLLICALAILWANRLAQNSGAKIETQAHSV
jgi:fucose permease